MNLAPGRYTVTAKLAGFTDYRNENVPVNAGSIVPLGVTLSVGGLSEKVDVTTETPVIEAKRQTVSTNVNLDELQNIPSARDPWVVLQTVPGIIVDRVNVGGAESGQQSNYQAKGANPDQNTWNMDGIAITDMGSLGASPTYYDFDMFQEMQVTTGGADPANATPGVQLNFVLRSGTSKWRGSTRYYFENDSLQSDNVSSDLFGRDRQLQPRRRVQGLGFRGRRTDPARQALRLGRLRQDRARDQRVQLRSHAQRLPADRARTRRSSRTSRPRSPASCRRRRAPTSPTSAATSRSSAAVRPASAPTRRPTTRMARPTSTSSSSTRRSAATCSSSAATPTPRTAFRSSRAAPATCSPIATIRTCITDRTGGTRRCARRTTSRSKATCSRAGTT